MKTIENYIKDYGKYTFLEKEFNEVDNVIFSLLSYINFSGIVPGIGNGSITIEKAAEMFYKDFSKKENRKNIIQVKAVNLLFKDIALANRYKDLELLNYEYKLSFDNQFGAVCIKLPNNTMYVSFEGTDAFLSGWKEDFMLTYTFPVKSQELAVNYLNKVTKFFGPKIYVGGHSKGGNLALVAAMYCKMYVYHKIKYIFNNDGPGLRESELNNLRYKRLLIKYSHIVPNECFIGLILDDKKEFTVIKSTKKSLFQHNAINWVVENDHLKRCELSKGSIRMKKAMLSWLNKLDDQQKEEFTVTLFNVLKDAGVNDLIEIKKSMISSMIKISKEMKNISKENKTLLTTTLRALYEEWKS